MKKRTILLTMVFLIAINSCEKTEFMDPQPKEVREFLNSEDFKKNECFFANYGQIGIGTVETLQVNEKTALHLLIPLLDGEMLVGYIQVLPVETEFLPNKDKYAINLIVFLKGFNTETITGEINMYDFNYDRFMHAKAKVMNKRILSWDSFSLPSDVSSKYESLRVSSSSKNMVSCDANGNGNIGFFECYRCVKAAIRENGFSQAVCDIPVAGWVSCSSATALACGVISMIY